MLQSVIVLVGTLLLTSLAAVVSQTLILKQEIRSLREYLSQRDAEVSRLTNLLASRDAMTYATLTQVTAGNSLSDPYQPVGTDAAEWAKWQQAMGNSDAEYNPRDDLEEMGLIQ